MPKIGAVWQKVHGIVRKHNAKKNRDFRAEAKNLSCRAKTGRALARFLPCCLAQAWESQT